MRISAALSFAALAMFFLARGAAGQQTGSVDGQVSNSNSGEPVANASLRLVLLRYTRSGNNNQPQTNSQPDGLFRFESVAPGNYVITAECPGFVSNEMNSKSRLITITAGQSLSGITISMTPTGTISGTIEEENGAPVPGSTVKALAALSSHGQTSLKLYGATTADANGKFELSKLPPPNDYYIVAEPPAGEKTSAKDGDLVRTFYPRSLNIEGGSAVPLSAGQSIPDITVEVRRTTTFHIRGKIADSPSQSGLSNLTLAVSPHGAVDSQSLTRKIVIGPDKTFDVGGLTPGAYTLRLTGNANGGGRGSGLLARQDVEIGGANVEGIVLSIMPALNVNGQIRADASENVPLPRVTVTARPLEDLPHSSQGFARVANDGSFTFNNLDPGLYVFQAFPATAGWYVKSITLNQQDVFNRGADLSEMSAARLEILMRPGAAEVDGTVPATGDAPVSTIVLVPQTVGPDGSGVLFGYSKQNGTFAVQNVRPGKYFAYAVQRGDPNLWQNPEFLRAMESLGSSLQVDENSKQQLQLPLLSLDQVEEAAGRVGLQIQ